MTKREQEYVNLPNEEKKKEFMNSFYEKYNKFFGVSEEELSSYYDEDKYTGYPFELGGAAWDLETKSIYCFIRCLKPKKILEIGNYKGVSSNHILQAVEMNGFGEVYLLDIKEQLEYDKLHNRNFNRVIADSLEYLNNPLDFDCIILDGCHEKKHVLKEIELITTNTTIDISLWAHDYFVPPQDYCNVKEAFDEKAHLFHDLYTMIDSYSNCGFLIAKFNK
jgi:hypothetical protein